MVFIQPIRGCSLFLAGSAMAILLTMAGPTAFANRVQPESSPCAIYSVANVQEGMESESQSPADSYITELYTVHSELLGDGILGFCGVQMTIMARFTPDGELYDVEAVTSKLNSSFVANSWTQTDYQVTVHPDGKDADITVNGYVEWSYDKYTTTSEHTLVCTNVLSSEQMKIENKEGGSMESWGTTAATILINLTIISDILKFVLIVLAICCCLKYLGVFKKK